MSSTNGITVNADKNLPKVSRKIKEPFKLVYQMIAFFSVVLPLTLWAIVSSFFTKKKSLRGEVVVITGAGRGLGRSLSLKFAKQGCKVACADVDEIGNKETVQLIKQNYPEAVAVAYKCNVALEEDIKCMSKNIANEIGEVDIIVNNAGLVSGSTVIDFDSTYLSTMLDVNLKSHFLMIKEFLPSMIKRNKGHVVAIASLAGLGGLAKASIYSATKHGLIGLMESLYDELRENPKNKVQTTCACPYFISTSPEYSKHWDLRLPEISVGYTANAIIDAVRKNVRVVAVPSFHYYSTIMLRLQPDILRNMLRDIFYTRFSLSKRDSEVIVNEVIKDIAERK